MYTFGSCKKKADRKSEKISSVLYRHFPCKKHYCARVWEKNKVFKYCISVEIT